MKSKHFHPLAALALGLALASPVLAQNAPEQRRVLTRAELRNCLANADTLEQKRVDYEAAGTALDKEVEALNQEHEAITQETLKAQGDSARTDRVELRQRRYVQKVKALQARLDAHRQNLPALQAERDAQNKQCANVAVLQEDKDAVMQERAAAGKK